MSIFQPTRRHCPSKSFTQAVVFSMTILAHLLMKTKTESLSAFSSASETLLSSPTSNNLATRSLNYLNQSQSRQAIQCACTNLAYSSWWLRSAPTLNCTTFMLRMGKNIKSCSRVKRQSWWSCTKCTDQKVGASTTTALLRTLRHSGWLPIPHLNLKKSKFSTKGHRMSQETMRWMQRVVRLKIDKRKTID